MFDNRQYFLGNANLVYTIIRKRQVYFALSNLATDSLTIAKLTSKTSSASTAVTNNRKITESLTNKQMIFQSNSKSNMDGEPPLNQDISPQKAQIHTISMTTTLAETPCKSDRLFDKDKFHCSQSLGQLKSH